MAKTEAVEPLDDLLLRPGAAVLADEQVTESGDGVHHGGDTPQARDRAAIEHRFHGDVVHQVGLERTDKPPERGEQSEFADQATRSPFERDGVVGEPVGLDFLDLLRIERGGDMDFETARLGGERDRHPVRGEEECLVHQVEEAARPSRRANAARHGARPLRTTKAWRLAGKDAIETSAKRPVAVRRTASTWSSSAMSRPGNLCRR